MFPETPATPEHRPPTRHPLHAMPVGLRGTLPETPEPGDVLETLLELHEAAHCTPVCEPILPLPVAIDWLGPALAEQLTVFKLAHRSYLQCRSRWLRNKRDRRFFDELVDYNLNLARVDATAGRQLFDYAADLRAFDLPFRVQLYTARREDDTLVVLQLQHFASRIW